MIKSLSHLTIYALFLGSIGAGAYNVTSNIASTPDKTIIASHDTEVYQGEYLEFKVDVERQWLGCQVDVENYIVATNGNRIKLGATSRLTDEKEVSLKMQIHIPIAIPPGYYKYYAEKKFTCNFVHKLFSPTTTETPSFFVQVLDRKDKPVYYNSKTSNLSGQIIERVEKKSK